MTRTSKVPGPIHLTASKFVERIILSTALLRQLHRHRQLHFWACEAGGQLFAKVSPEEIEIVKCTGPYSNDRRSRYAYRSDPKQAQSAIQREVREGLFYVGEWHTHPEPIPSASSLDVDAFIKTNRRSNARFGPLILLIQGTQTDPSGSTVYSCHGGMLLHWTAQLHADTPAQSCDVPL